MQKILQILTYVTILILPSFLATAQNKASLIDTYVLYKQFNTGELEMSEDLRRNIINQLKLQIQTCKLETGDPRIVFAENTEFENSDGTCELNASFEMYQKLTSLELDYLLFLKMAELTGTSFEKCKKIIPYKYTANDFSYPDKVYRCSLDLVEKNLREQHSQ